VIERVLENLREMTEDFGPGCFANQIDELTKYIIMFLQKVTFCQNGANMVGGDPDEYKDEQGEDYGEESEEGDDGIDHDEVILGCVTDLIYESARSFGNEYAPYFN